MNYIRSFLILSVLLFPSRAAELALVGPADLYRFAGAATKVPLTVQSSASAEVKSALSYRIYQASSATVAPLGDPKEIGEKQLEPDEAITFSVPFEAPEVRAITRFVMKVRAGEEELGSVAITVVPQKLFAQLAKDLEGSVELFEPEPALASILTESGVQLNADSETSSSKIAVVRLPSKAAEQDWKEQHANIKQTLPTLFIVGPGVTGSEKLLPFKSLNRKNFRAAVLQEWFVPEIKTDALSQLRLLRAVQSIAKPEQENDPAGKQKTN